MRAVATVTASKQTFLEFIIAPCTKRKHSIAAVITWSSYLYTSKPDTVV